MVARKKAKVKGKKSKKSAQRKKIIRRLTPKKRAKKAAKKAPIKKSPAKKSPAKKKISAAKKRPAPKRKPSLPAQTPNQIRATKGWQTRKKTARKKAKRQREIRKSQDQRFPATRGISKAYEKEIARLEKENQRIRKEAAQAKEAAYLRGQQEERERTEAQLSESDKRRIYLENLLSKTAQDFVESDESMIIARLRLAADYGELEQEIDSVSEEYDMDAHEIYDLYYGES